MAAIDDSWDVHDYCVKLGLDPDRVSHLNRARSAMYAEAEKRRVERDKRDLTLAQRVDRQIAAEDARAKFAEVVSEGFKSRYGSWAVDVLTEDSIWPLKDPT
jgi:hypothetical protein